MPPAAIAEAKKQSGGSAVIKGFCSYEDGTYIFETAKAAASTAAQATKVIAKRDAGLAIHPEFRTSNDPELLTEDGDTPPVVPPRPNRPAPQQPPNVQPQPTEDLAHQFTNRLKQVAPEYQKALASTPSTVGDKLKSQMAIVNSHYQQKNYQGGLDELKTLADRVEIALAGLTGNEQGGVEITTEVAEGLASLFDEDSGPYQYQAARTTALLSFEPALEDRAQVAVVPRQGRRLGRGRRL